MKNRKYISKREKNTKTRKGRDSKTVMMHNIVLYLYLQTILNYTALRTQIFTPSPE